MRYLKVFIILFIFVMYGCSDKPNDPVIDETGTSASQYFPGKIGSRFIYSVEEFDSSQGIFLHKGEKEVTYNNIIKLRNTDYVTQENKYIIPEKDTTGISYFRLSDRGVYYFIDTTGFGNLISSLPDTLKSLLSFSIDEEMNVLSLPFFEGKTWTAYQLSLSIPTFAYELSIVDITATYRGKESVSVPFSESNVDSERIEYKITLRIPTIENLLNPPTTVFISNAYFIENTGLVKIEGNTFLINALSGGGIELADSSGITRELLVDKEIK